MRSLEHDLKEAKAHRPHIAAEQARALNDAWLNLADSTLVGSDVSLLRGAELPAADLLVGIMSAREHRSRRDIIRRTWLSAKPPK